LKLLLHHGEEGLLIGITIERVTDQGGADGGDFVGYVGGIGSGFLELILKQVALDLVVVDADGDDDGAESAIVGGEAAADFLRGTVEAANGEQSVCASTDQEGEKPAKGD